MAYAEKITAVSYDSDASIGIYTGPPNLAGSAVPNYGKQFCFVKVTGSRVAGLAVANTDLIVGVMQNKPQHPGSPAEVAIMGITLLQVGAGGLTAGQAVKCDANGNAVAATVGTDIVRGVCVIGGAAGSVASVQLQGLG